MVAAVPVSTMLPGCVDITRGIEPDAGRTDWYRLSAGEGTAGRGSGGVKDGKHMVNRTANICARS